MIRSRVRVLVLALVCAPVLAGCVDAYQATADDPAGALKPTLKDKDAGLVGIASGFDLKDFRVIAVELFPVTDPAIKDDEDRQLASLMEAFFQAELVRRLRGCGLFERVINLSESDWRPGSEKALILGGRITRLGEGSQPLRALLGAGGAGKVGAQAEMTFVDAQTGQPVLVTADRRVAQTAVLGGDGKDHLRESFDDMARDLERFLIRLTRGEAPKEG